MRDAGPVPHVDAADDAIEAAFTHFRTNARTEIRPPGAAAARRTTTRRRTSRVVLAMAAVISIASAATVIGLGTGPDRDPPGPPGPSIASPSARPTVDAEQANSLRLQALTELGHGDGTGQLALGAMFTSVAKSTSGTPLILGSQYQPFPPGDRYKLRAVCVGQGAIAVTWSGAGGSGEVHVRCGESEVATPVVLTAESTIRVVLRPDGEAMDRSALAMVLEHPSLVAARAALPTGSPDVYAAGNVLLTARPYDSSSEGGTDEPGPHTLTIVCVGVGRIAVTFSVDQHTTSATYNCSTDPTRRTLKVTSTVATHQTRVTITPDPVATNSAAVSYNVARH